MNQNIFIGIDGGLAGGIAIYNSDTNILLTYPMPVIDVKSVKGNKKEYDVKALVDIFLVYRDSIKMVILEKAQAMPGQGVVSMFNIGKNYGIMQGILVSLQIPYQLVHPKSWQKKMFEGMPQQDTKQASILTAQRLFPKNNFKATQRSQINHNGMTDAALMAYYGCLMHNLIK